jgi:cell division protein FtsI/penicillin-binding protein 2
VRRTAAALGLVVLAGCTSAGSPPPQETAAAKAAATFARGWSAGDRDALRASVDAPAAALDAMAAAEEALQITETQVRSPGDPVCGADRCTDRLQVTHELAGAGSWRYGTTVQLRRERRDRWLVHWTPQTFHPALRAGTVLERARRLPVRAPILDRQGRELTRQRPVVRVGVVPRKVQDSTYADLADLLDIDPAGLRQRVKAAQPDWFVDVITLRREDYTPLRPQLLDVAGITLDPTRMSLAPTSTWGRAVLGVVAPPTAESLQAAGPLADAGDMVGASGLQAAYQRQLAGQPALRIRVVDEESGRLVETLLSTEAVAGRPLRTTLDYAVQSAAERAVAEQVRTTALVAVRASTGEVLAAANGPEATSYNSAFVGQYPPGSTFKVVTAAALLDDGVVDVRGRVPCPDALTVDGKTFTNYEPGLLPGGGTFLQAFAESCNTTMVGFAGRLGSAALAGMAKRFGVGARWDLGLDAYSGQAPAPADPVQRAAAMIGQGEVLASPLGMALVAAAVASGQPTHPTLLPAEKLGGRPGQPLPGALARDLRTMMRAVVTSGTGTAVDLPGEPVYAKTGTAEYGSAPTRTHAWLIGFRGDVAFAVVVENGESGGRDAAPVVTAFLDDLPARAYR